MTTRRETGRETMMRRSDPMVSRSEQIPGPSSQAGDDFIEYVDVDGVIILMSLIVMMIVRSSEQIPGPSSQAEDRNMITICIK